MNRKMMLGMALAGAMLAWSGSAEAACRDGKNRRVRVVNDTSYTLTNLYGSNVSRDSWEEDVLGRGVLRPGASTVVNWDDGSCYCNFDFKAVFSDNTETVRRGYNVCTGAEWRIHE